MSTRKQVWQYRCDFCPKCNLSASGIAKHEKHCTNNPDRVCRMCPQLEVAQKPIGELIAVLSVDKEDYGIEELREKAQYCPMCILSAIRQSRIREKYKEEQPDEYAETGPLYINWDYKKELEAAWKDVNQTRAEAENSPY